jgi:hypothetical protein
MDTDQSALSFKEMMADHEYEAFAASKMNNVSVASQLEAASPSPPMIEQTESKSENKGDGMTPAERDLVWRLISHALIPCCCLRTWSAHTKTWALTSTLHAMQAPSTMATLLAAAQLVLPSMTLLILLAHGVAASVTKSKSCTNTTRASTLSVR